MDLEEIKHIILSIIRSSPRRQMTIDEIKIDLRKTAHLDINKITSSAGFGSILELLNEFRDVLKINNNGPRALIEAVHGDHVSEMNRFSKNKKPQRNPIQYRRAFPPDDIDEIFKMSEHREFNEESDYASFIDGTRQIPLSAPPEYFRPRPPPPANRLDAFLVDKLKENVETNFMTSSQNEPPKPTENEMEKLTEEFYNLRFIHSNDKNYAQLDEIPFGPDDNVRQIVILDSVNPHRFWFCLKDEFDGYIKFKERLKAFYESNKESFKVSALDMRKRGLCAVVFRKKGVFRVRILKSLGGTSYRAFMVDKGSIIASDISNFRYLKEEFFPQPAFARRGVLAHVQPVNNFWKMEATKFFYKKVVKQTVDAKIYRTTNEDSYYMSLKLKINENNHELISNELIARNFATHDKLFLLKDPINRSIMSFAEHEEGKYFDISIATLQPVDSWTPREVNVQRPQRKITAAVRANQSRTSNLSEEPIYPPTRPSASTFHERSTKSKQPQNSAKPRFNLNRNRSKISVKDVQLTASNSNESNPSTIVASVSTGSSADKEKIVEYIEWQIAPQKFDTMQVDRELSMSIHYVNKPNVFFFYNLEEIPEIKCFMDEFNKSYKEEKKYLAQSEIKLNKDVVVFHDQNYCRGRVMSRKGSNEYELFLLDYGVFTVRTIKEIFHLRKEFMHRQAAVYKGRLCNEQAKQIEVTKQPINKLILGLKDKRIAAKIVSVNAKGVIELKILDLDETQDH